MKSRSCPIRWTLVPLALVLGAAMPVLAQDRRTPELPPGRLIDVGGYRLHLLCTGPEGVEPTVILSAGGGGLAVDWDLVQGPLAETHRICSYDRANEGWSDLGPNPRTFRQEVFELHAALRAAGEASPYVLVGHSLGGLVVREFVSQYPTEVVGVVLVESTHESARLGYQGALVRVRELATGRPIPSPRTLAESPPVLMSDDGAARCRAAASSSTIFGPFANLSNTAQARRLWLQRNPKCYVLPEDYLPEELAELHARRLIEPQPFGELPLVAILGERISVPPGVDAEEWRRERQEQMVDLSRLSRRGRLIAGPSSGHSVHLDNPLVVVSAVREVIADSRR